MPCIVFPADVTLGILLAVSPVVICLLSKNEIDATARTSGYRRLYPMRPRRID